MRIYRRSAVFVATAALVGGFSAAPAAADPARGFPVTLTCATLGQVDVLAFSSGDPAAGLLIDSNGVFVPYAIDASGTFTPSEGEPVPILERYTHPAPSNGRLDECTFSISQSDENGQFFFAGTIWVSYTPKALTGR
jgi:hypothetical protein